MTDLEFSARLKNCISASGKTQVEIANDLDISKHTIQKYLNGRIPDAKILYKMASYFGKTMEWLLVGIDSTNVQQNTNNKVEAVFDLDLKKMTDTLSYLMTQPDERLRTWTVVQFEKAFKDELALIELEKKHNA